MTRRIHVYKGKLYLFTIYFDEIPNEKYGLGGVNDRVSCIHVGIREWLKEIIRRQLGDIVLINMFIRERIRFEDLNKCPECNLQIDYKMRPNKLQTITKINFPEDRHISTSITSSTKIGELKIICCEDPDSYYFRDIKPEYIIICGSNDIYMENDDLSISDYCSGNNIYVEFVDFDYRNQFYEITRDPPLQIPVEVPQTIPECVICLSEERTHMLTPCNHLCLCLTCSKNMKKCPSCRTPVRNVVRVYIP